MAGLRRYLPLIAIAALSIIVVRMAASWSSLSFAKLEAADLGGRFAGLLFFALLIERTVEVLLSIWRSEKSNMKQAEVQRLVSAGIGATDPDMQKAQNALIEYRAETMRWALPISFCFGLIVAGIGVRFVDQFIDPMSRPNPEAPQYWWFHVADIFFTAALLAGGADPIHKVLDAFRKFMETSSARSSGTKA